VRYRQHKPKTQEASLNKATQTSSASVQQHAHPFISIHNPHSLQIWTISVN